MDSHTGESQKQFETLLAPILQGAFGMALNLTRNRDDAEDLVQEAAINAFSAFSHFQSGTNFRAWYFKIVLNCFRNRWRKKQREPHTVDIEDATDLFLFDKSKEMPSREDGGDPALIVIEQMSLSNIEESMNRLPDDFKECALLYFLQEMSYQEIAEALDCPIGTVRSRLHRARKLLQKTLWSVAVEAGLTNSANLEGEGN